jgi:hypothetical protein
MRKRSASLGDEQFDVRNSNQPLTEHRSEVSQSDFAILSFILDSL